MAHVSVNKPLELKPNELRQVREGFRQQAAKLGVSRALANYLMPDAEEFRGVQPGRTFEQSLPGIINDALKQAKVKKVAEASKKIGFRIDPVKNQQRFESYLATLPPDQRAARVSQADLVRANRSVKDTAALR